MAKITWTAINDRSGSNFSNSIMSMNITGGREKYLDTYSGGRCVITINNANNIASGFVYGDKISVFNGVGATYISLNFWVQEVTFQDYPGNTGVNTATITCVDFMSRAGRITANALSLAQASTYIQATKFNATEGGPMPSDMSVTGYAGTAGSIASAKTYTGTVNNYLNLLVATERGYLIERAGLVVFVTRTDASSLAPQSVIIGRTTSTTQIAYSQFERIQNGTQFINTATIQPDGLTEQTVVNTSSQTTYGPAFYSSATQDYTTGQAADNGSWIVNTFSDPASLRFVCSFTDVMQNDTALTSWISQFWGLTASRCINLSYQVPAGSLTTTTVIGEGFEINVIPGQTTFRLSFSPLQYYQFFTLDSTSLGILDTSRLGW